MQSHPLTLKLGIAEHSVVHFGVLAALLWWLALGFALTLGHAYAQPTKLYPQVKALFAAPAWRISIDHSESVIAFGMGNNTVAETSLRSAESVRIHYVPVREEENQRAHPVALSPDGLTIAYGVPTLRDANGWPVTGTAQIYILNRLNGRIIGSIAGLPTRAQDLKFSADGRFMAAALSAGCGVRVWSTENWREFARDDVGYAGRDAPESACTEGDARARHLLPDTHTVLFTPHPKAWLVTVGMTGVRAYEAQAGGIQRVAYREPLDIGVLVPDGAAVSPDGMQIAIGDRAQRTTNKPLKIVVLDLDNLAARDSPISVRDEDLDFPERVNPAVSPDAAQFNLGKVAWFRTEQAEWLVAAGSFPCNAAMNQLVVGTTDRFDLCAFAWKLTDKSEIRVLPHGTDQAVDVAAIKSRREVVVLSNRGVSLLHFGDPQTTASALPGELSASTADFRSTAEAAFMLSADATKVHFSDYQSASKELIQFDVSTLKLSTVGTPRQDFRSPDTNPVLLSPPEQWVNKGMAPMVVNAPIEELEQVRDVYRAAAVLPGNRISLVSANHIYVVGIRDARNTVLCKMRIRSEGFRINSSEDGRTLVVAHGDGVLRWYRLHPTSDGKCAIDPLLAVLFRKVREEWSWSAWIPSTGEFSTDGKSPNPLVWQVLDERCELKPVSLGPLTAELYDAVAVKQALSAPADRPSAADALIQKLLVRCGSSFLNVTRPRVKSRVHDEVVDVELAMKDDSQRLIYASLGNQRRLEKEYKSATLSADEPLVARERVVKFKVRLPTSELTPNAEFHLCFLVGSAEHCQPLMWAGASAKPKPRRLWLVTVGVAHYGKPDKVPDLRFAQNDAIDIASLFLADFRRQERNGDNERDFHRISVDLLVSGPPIDAAKAELLDFAKDKMVHVGEGTPNAVFQALRRIADVAGKDPAFDDVLVLSFSGHGTASPVGASKGASALLFPSALPANLDVAPLSSADLLEHLSRITAKKVVVLDACRNLPNEWMGTPFDPAKVRSEFEDSLTSAHILLSTEAGMKSTESSIYTRNESRAAGQKGNGVFTYALLEALMNPGTDSILRALHPGKLTADEVGNAVREIFLNRKGESPLFQQVPIYLPGRTAESLILRTLQSPDRPQSGAVPGLQ